MARSTLNFIIDVVAFLIMLAMVATGLLMRFVLPPGSGGRLSLWLGTRHDWGEVHFWLAVGLAALLLLHLALHWSWVCGLVASWLRRPHTPAHPPHPLRRNLLGTAILAAVVACVGGFVWIAQSNVVERAGNEFRQHRGRDAASVERFSPGQGLGRGGRRRASAPAE